MTTGAFDADAVADVATSANTTRATTARTSIGHFDPFFADPLASARFRASRSRSASCSCPSMRYVSYISTSFGHGGGDRHMQDWVKRATAVRDAANGLGA